MTIRSAFVDWAKANLSATFGARVYDRFLPVLELNSAGAMAPQFPALVVSTPSWTPQQCLSGAVAYRGSQVLQLEVVGIVTPANLYALSEAVRAAEVAKLRAVDTATEAVVAALAALGSPVANFGGSGAVLKGLRIEAVEDSEEFPESGGGSVSLISSTINISATLSP